MKRFHTIPNREVIKQNEQLDDEALLTSTPPRSAFATACKSSFKSMVTHIELIFSGETRRDVKFSPIVAMSSFLFLLVALPHFQTKTYAWAAVWCLVSLCSLLADSLWATNKYVNIADRVVATAVFFGYPIPIIVWPGPNSWDFRLAISILAVISLSFLQWARGAAIHSEFVLRQSLWHLVVSLSLWYTSHKNAYGYIHDWYSLS